MPPAWKLALLAGASAVAATAVLLAAISIQRERPRPLPGAEAAIGAAQLGLGAQGGACPEEGAAFGNGAFHGGSAALGDGAASESHALPAGAASRAVAALPPEPAPRRNRGTLVFVIDDAGNNLRELEPFLRFPGAITIAVLPGLPHSAEAARRARAAGKEVFLHQPMEAVGGEDPGPGAIYSWMSDEEVLEVLSRNLAEIGPVAGMNNHQGSRITADARIMETVLGFARDNGILFLDSKTTAASAAPAVAQRMGMAIGARNVFIDNERDRPSMARAIEEGLGIASRRGSAVMIGHAWSPELAPLLKDLYQGLIDQGFAFATASQLIYGDF